MNVTGHPTSGMGDRELTMDFGISSFLSSEVFYDQWIPLPASGRRPSARYKHAAEMVLGKLYVIGGSRNGRYLSDIQVFDLRTLTWYAVKPNQDPSTTNSSDETLPACAGHSLVKWENKLLVVAGHSKEKSNSVTVWSIDLETHSCEAIKTHGNVPIARGGQSVSMVGSKLLMFGGEDSSRRLLNDLHILDLETMTWDAVDATPKSPAPRFDHTAVVHADQYLLIFGGSSHSTCFNDLHVLDLQTMEWSEPQTQGEGVTPRGGHAGTALEDNWYIVGGGNNMSGACETIKLNMSKLVWSVATNVRERDPLASEGLSLCSTTIDGEKLLVAFGGYNGKYHNEVFILKPKPSYSKQPRIFQSPAAAAAAASVTAAYALTTAAGSKKLEILHTHNKNHNEAPVESSPRVDSIAADAIISAKKILESKISEVRAENLLLKGSLDETSNSHIELSKELQSVQSQLDSERSRCSKLELQIAEILKRLESLPSIEHELNILRHQKSASEQDLANAQRQRSGGVWQWMAGTSQSPDQ